MNFESGGSGVYDSGSYEYQRQGRSVTTNATAISNIVLLRGHLVNVVVEDGNDQYGS